VSKKRAGIFNNEQRKHYQFDQKPEDARDQTATVPVDVRGFGEEGLHVEERLSSDNGLSRRLCRSAVAIFEKEIETDRDHETVCG